MAGITSDTSFELDGMTTVDIGEWGHFEWSTGGTKAWMGPVEVGPSGSVDPGIKVDVTLSGRDWDMHSLRINMGAEFDVTVTDNTKGAGSVWIGYLNLSHGPSKVVLKNASVDFINGGRGDDDVTVGSGRYSQVALRQGNNKAKTGDTWVDSITAGDGNDRAVIGSGGAGQVLLNHGNNTFTANGWFDALVARDGNDKATSGDGGGRLIDLGLGNNKFVTGKGGVAALYARDGDDEATIGDGGAGSVNLGGGNNKFTTGKGYVEALIGHDGDDVATIGKGGAGLVKLNHGNNTFTTGKGWVDSIVAYGGDDVATIGGEAGSVNLGHGNNTVTTGKGWVDSIVVRNGDDVVNVGSGGLGFVNLGGGNDRIVLSRQDNKDWLVSAQGGGGTDTVDFSALSRGIDWNSDAAYTETRDGNFLMMSFENVIGTRKADKLGGSDADNVIDAGKGKDKLTGGGGADDLLGGAGKDTFIFLSASDSTVAGKGRDVIGDFSQKQKDKIDLRAIDAIAGGSDNKFSFIGSADFSNTAGELRFEQDDDVTTVYGDTDGDGTEDFAIDLAGLIDLKGGDFLL